MGQLIPIRGTHLWVEDLGRSHQPVILYVHGGPGSGAYDFVFYQGKRLASLVRLIAVDQREVLRSDPLGSGRLHVRDLVEDMDALRVTLGISRWSLIGHSFGGYLAVLYAKTYPLAIDRLILENPSFDLAASARSLLQKVSLQYAAMGNQDKAYTCLDIAYNTSLDSRSTWEYWGYYDAVFGLDQLWQYRHAKPDTNLVVAAESSHFVHVEEPELFATAVANYLNSKPRTITPS